MSSSNYIIDNITYHQNGDVTLTINDTAYRIDGIELSGFNLIKGSVVSEADLDRLSQLDQRLQVLNKARTLIAIRMHSEAELRRKLIPKKYDLQAIDWTLGYLKDLNLINDVRYTEMLIASNLRKNKSMYQIKAKLHQSGISTDLISESTQNPDYLDSDSNSIEKIFLKLQKSTKFQTLPKIKKIQKLVAKGFSYDSARSVVDGSAVDNESGDVSQMR